MPSHNKGKWIEPGIWEVLVGKGYMAEASYTHPKTGKRVRERKTTNRLDLAQKWRLSLKADALRGQITRRRDQQLIFFKDFADEYYEAWSLNRKPSTAHGEKKRLDGIIKPYFGKKYIHTINRKDIETLLRRRQEGPMPGIGKKRRNKRNRGVSKATVNRELCRLKNMFKYAVNWEYLQDNPVIGIPQEREPIKEADYLDQEEARRFLDALGPNHRPIFTVSIYTGIRFTKVVQLKWEDVEFERRRIAVRDPKNGEDRYVTMHQEVLNALEVHFGVQEREFGAIQKYAFINPRTKKPYTDLKKPMKEALLEAGITRHFKFHGLRHTLGSHLAMSGATEREIAEILGHKDPKMPRRYSHLSPEHVRIVIDRVNYSSPEGEGTPSTGSQ